MKEEQKKCEHKLKHTERLILKQSIESEKMRYVIMTYCADCGEELNCILIRNKS